MTTNKQLVISSFSDDIRTATSILKTDIPKISGNQILIKNKYVGINALYDRELYVSLRATTSFRSSILIIPLVL